ncbi:MAG TPA: DNA mismatch repair protein MutS [Gemmataceae bacterium]|nr:DNA mismatch repair protein MutS [Gemmataceae bacterium]
MSQNMMQQYQEAKERHPGMLLLFQNGSFYEFFHDDAVVGSRILGLTLTRREKTIPMAGFRTQDLETYLPRLLHAGHRVAVCDQVEDPALAKGLVQREVTRVVTPGTLTEDSLLDPRQSNHLVALAPPSLPSPTRGGRVGRGGPTGVAWVDLSTGSFYATDIPREKLADELSRLAPAEALHSDAPAATAEIGALLTALRELLPNLSVTPRPNWNFDPDSARAALMSHFGVTTLAGFGFDDNQPCIAAAGALLLYLRETLKADLGHLTKLRPRAGDRFLFLDEVTRRSLELTRTLRDGGRAGSLLAVMDRTTTPMGARLLQEWIVAPLADHAAIDARLDAVAELKDDHALRQDLRTQLSAAHDLQRLTTRVSTGRASPRDLAAVGRTLALLPRIKAKVTARHAALLRDLESRLELCPDLREAIESALVDAPPISAKEGGVIKPGYDAGLDALHAITKHGKEWMTQFQAAEIARTGINSLKVGYNQVHGYYIEITHTHGSRVPDNYERRQTLKNAERYVTPELKEYEEQVLTAQEKIQQREYDLFTALRERTAAQTGRLMQAGEVLAALDALAGLAELAAERNYCRPALSDGRDGDTPPLQVRDGRHPVLDQIMPPGTFVPNDLTMGPDKGTILLITGPNMGGKSCYIRQAALLTLMAQMGSFVPAKEALIGLADRIFTRVGASDELSRAQSTFMVEMTEAADILNNATARSLVILDEIGRGTSTYDGVSLAWSIAEYLHDQIGCRTLFATHYHELAQLAERLPKLRNYNALVHEGPEGILFLHKIAPGSADKSYGIHVAERAGVPADVLSRAREVLTELETHYVNAPPREGGRIRKPKLAGKSLFAGVEDPVMQELRETEVDALTPEDVAALVKRWQRELRG